MTKLKSDKEWIRDVLAKSQMTEQAKARADALEAMREPSGLSEDEWTIFKSMFEFAYAAGVRDTLSSCPLVKTVLAKALAAEMGAEIVPASEADKAGLSTVETHEAESMGC